MFSIFNSLKEDDIADVTIKQEGKREIKISAEENLLSKVMTKIKKEKLIISVKKWPQDTNPPKINITMEEISELQSEGSSHIKSENAIRADSLFLEVGGAGKINLQVSAEKIKTKLSGSGIFILTGRTSSHDVNIDGSGQIAAFDLAAENTSINLSGAGEVQVNVSRKLDVTIRGIGYVKYKGKPKVKSKITGPGSLESVE